MRQSGIASPYAYVQSRWTKIRFALSNLIDFLEDGTLQRKLRDEVRQKLLGTLGI